MDRRPESNFIKYATEYDPKRIGWSDGNAKDYHDKALIRAENSEYFPNKKLKSDPEKTLFVGRLHDATDEKMLKDKFRRYGEIRSVRVVRDIVTGLSKNYAFIEFKHRGDAKEAYHEMHERVIDNCKILVDFEHGRVMPGWKPRRLGGGFGGKKESGQLRFGCRDRPFQKQALGEISRKRKKLTTTVVPKIEKLD